MKLEFFFNKFFKDNNNKNIWKRTEKKLFDNFYSARYRNKSK